MIAKIAPIVRLSSKADVFDYSIPDEIYKDVSVGSLVEIPWRSQKKFGIVLDLSEEKKTKFVIRPILKLAHNTPVVTKEQIKLIKKFSVYYATTNGYIAKLIVPEKPKRKILKFKKPDLIKFPFSIQKSNVKKLKESFKKISKSEEYRVIARDISSVAYMARSIVEKGGHESFLFLFPTIKLAQIFYSHFSNKYLNSTAIIHSEMSKNLAWEEYEKILSGKARIVFSTRQGIFLPIKTNPCIFVFDSQNEDFKQKDQHPRYDSRVILKWLFEFLGGKIIHIETSEPVFKNNLNTINLPEAFSAPLFVSLIDMQKEMQKKDFSIIADKTFEEIKENIKNKKKVLVLAIKKESEKGVSVDSIYNELTKLIKNCKIYKYQEINNKIDDFDIVIGSPSMLENLEIINQKSKIGLLVISSVEPILAMPDYKSAERTYNKLNNWRFIAKELKISKIILQTYSPDSLALKAFAFGEIDDFQKNEIENRKSLGYPPFGSIIKLTYKGEDKNTPNYIKEKLQKEITDGKIIGPFNSNEKQTLLLKLKNNTKASLEILKLNSDWKIDIDPEMAI